MNAKRFAAISAIGVVLLGFLMAKPASVVGQGTATVAATMQATSASTSSSQGRIAATYLLSDTPLATAQNSILKGSITNDRKLLIGAIGSDLWHMPNDKPDEFWMITDRGPNGEIKVGDAKRRTFPVPAFDPTILHVKVSGTTMSILEMLPIVTTSGKPVTGLPNLEGHDEAPYDYSAQVRLDFNQNGLDTEGITRTSRGDFWLSEEYGPSILHVDKTGQVLKRYVPEGLKYTTADYPIEPTLPSIFGKRKTNRGFEGLTLSPDEKTLYIVLQSPLLVPDKKTGEASRQTRVLAFDIAAEKVVAEYVYRFDVATEYGEKTVPADMKISAVSTINATTLLILERTDYVAKLYMVDVTKATNILGMQWDDPTNTASLENLADPANNQVTVLPKIQVIDLSKLSGIPDKVEGLTVVDKTTVAIANDNDYDVGTFDADGSNKGEGLKNKLLVITLEKPLP